MSTALRSLSRPTRAPPHAGSPYRALVNAAVLRLQELGRLHDLKQRWWKERKEGGKCKVGAGRGRSVMGSDWGLEKGPKGIGEV